MNRSLPAVALGLLLLGAAPSIAQDTQGGYADLVARILPSVVNIAVRAQRRRDASKRCSDRASSSTRRATSSPIATSSSILTPLS